MKSDFRLDLLIRAALAVIVLLCIVRVRATGAQTPPPVRWSVRGPAAGIRAGGHGDVTVVAEIPAGWHVYSLTQPEGGPSALTIRLADDQRATIAGAPRGPKPRVDKQSAFDVPVELYDSGRAEFTVPIRLTAAASGHIQTLRLQVTWQSCSDSICLPPRSVELPVDVTIAAK